MFVAPFEFVMAGDRIFQFFESRHEWRVITVNRKHPKNLAKTYMGNSVGKWESETFVVDTIGFNGKEVIEPVGVNHLMSDAFHLTERWQRVDEKTLELSATYYDSKIWGAHSWTGFHINFVLQRNLQLAESYCSIHTDNAFKQRFVDRTPSTPTPQ